LVPDGVPEDQQLDMLSNVLSSIVVVAVLRCLPTCMTVPGAKSDRVKSRHEIEVGWTRLKDGKGREKTKSSLFNTNQKPFCG
jgi:hypothetical protein